jgi:hypothetical protein
MGWNSGNFFIRQDIKKEKNAFEADGQKHLKKLIRE